MRDLGNIKSIVVEFPRAQGGGIESLPLPRQIFTLRRQPCAAPARATFINGRPAIMYMMREKRIKGALLN